MRAIRCSGGVEYQKWLMHPLLRGSAPGEALRLVQARGREIFCHNHNVDVRNDPGQCGFQAPGPKPHEPSRAILRSITRVHTRLTADTDQRPPTGAGLNKILHPPLTDDSDVIVIILTSKHILNRILRPAPERQFAWPQITLRPPFRFADAQLTSHYWARGTNHRLLTAETSYATTLSPFN